MIKQQTMKLSVSLCVSLFFSTCFRSCQFISAQDDQRWQQVADLGQSDVNLNNQNNEVDANWDGGGSNNIEDSTSQSNGSTDLQEQDSGQDEEINLESGAETNVEQSKESSEDSQEGLEQDDSLGDLRKLVTALQEEIKKLKENMNGAVSKFETTLEKDLTSRMRRHTNFQSGGPNSNGGPYQACVSIQSFDDSRVQPFFGGGGGGSTSGSYGSQSQNAPVPTVQEYMPTHPPAQPAPNFPINANSLESSRNNPLDLRIEGHPGHNGHEHVDLSQVYWLRLGPQRKPEELQSKVQRLLSDKQQSGNDVLVIPISNEFKTPADVKQGFMRAVRVRPDAVKSRPRLFRQLRSLHILEL